MDIDECNAIDCTRYPTEYVAKSWYCPVHARTQTKIRRKIEKYKDKDESLAKELKWRLREMDLRRDLDKFHLQRIRFLEEHLGCN